MCQYSFPSWSIDESEPSLRKQLAFLKVSDLTIAQTVSIGRTKATLIDEIMSSCLKSSGLKDKDGTFYKEVYYCLGIGRSKYDDYSGFLATNLDVSWSISYEWARNRFLFSRGLSFSAAAIWSLLFSERLGGLICRVPCAKVLWCIYDILVLREPETLLGTVLTARWIKNSVSVYSFPKTTDKILNVIYLCWI